jgi:hypothetical protein
MKASDFIQDLRRLIDEHGDLDVVVDDDSAALVEFNDDDDPVFVVI